MYLRIHDLYFLPKTSSRNFKRHSEKILDLSSIFSNSSFVCLQFPFQPVRSLISALALVPALHRARGFIMPSLFCTRGDINSTEPEQQQRCGSMGVADDEKHLLQQKQYPPSRKQHDWHRVVGQFGRAAAGLNFCGKPGLEKKLEFLSPNCGALGRLQESPERSD